MELAFFKHERGGDKEVGALSSGFVLCFMCSGGCKLVDIVSEMGLNLAPCGLCRPN